MTNPPSTPSPSTPLTYQAAGVNYDVMDAFKRACQKFGAATASALTPHHAQEVPGTRGESAYLIDAGDEYLAHVEEALGTKTLVADALYALTKTSYYKNVAIDDVSTIVNDLCVCGALPLTVAMYAAVGDSEYFADARRARDLAEGFAEGCRLSGAAWSGGETQTLKGMISPGALILGGSALGRIRPKHHRITGELAGGEDIIFLASSGVQTNGLTLCRALADRLPAGYLTPLPDGSTYGQALLAPSVIYAPFIAACQQANLPLKYAVHMTGHGWRKLMRSTATLVYRIEEIGVAQPVFGLIARTAQLDAHEMYGTFNMGVGFAVYVDPRHTAACLAVAKSAGFTAWRAGQVLPAAGRKAVDIPPLGLSYPGDSLQVR